MDDLADFLRTRRSRIDPASVGITPDARRRVTGLRREEIAHLSGVSVDYYVRLEQGRARQPSEQILDALARVLGLNRVERAHLHRLAHRPRRAPGREAARGPVRRPELLRVVELIPDNPAFIADQHLDVMAANRLAELLYGRRPMCGMNIARHIFLEADARELYADWETCTRDTVGQLRLAAGKDPDDPQLTALIGELAVHSERFRKLWAQADVRCRSHGRKFFAHPQVGDLELHQENFMVPGDSGTELVILSAQPGSKAHDGLRLLASIGATDDRDRSIPRTRPSA
ncbi:helix-turn-helix transcriptional regulator [Nocardia vaccinii]|uniref:helix-turn-helix transcriptional regulator n=1 Tax=Nocardia vaccinii TaxID=1822 RepID=UPI00082DAF65|nr:helix-turn-helix transcriptional regulator [Nocardia vaccinii]